MQPASNETNLLAVAVVGLVVLAAVVGVAALVRLLVREWKRRG